MLARVAINYCLALLWRRSRRCAEGLAFRLGSRQSRLSSLNDQIARHRGAADMVKMRLPGVDAKSSLPSCKTTTSAPSAASALIVASTPGATRPLRVEKNFLFYRRLRRGPMNTHLAGGWPSAPPHGGARACKGAANVVWGGCGMATKCPRSAVFAQNEPQCRCRVYGLDPSMATCSGGLARSRSCRLTEPRGLF